MEAHALFLMIGARPHSDWLPAEVLCDSGGFVRTGAETRRTSPRGLSTAPRFGLETSMPGVFAVGDVRGGSMNRVAAAVGEGSVAVRLVHELFAVERLGSEP